jgi:hypothetical protein
MITSTQHSMFVRDVSVPNLQKVPTEASALDLADPTAGAARLGGARTSGGG